MRLAALIAALSVSACGSCASPVPENEVVEPPAHQATALEVINLVDPSEMTITWMRGDCLSPTGLVGCKTGLERHGCDIYVLKRFSIRISALVHEMVHCRLELDTGDNDPHHRSGMWNIVRPVNDHLWSWEQCVVWDCDALGIKH